MSVANHESPSLEQRLESAYSDYDGIVKRNDVLMLRLIVAQRVAVSAWRLINAPNSFVARQECIEALTAWGESNERR